MMDQEKIRPMKDQEPQEIIDSLPVAYVEVNAEGIVVRANRAGRAMHAPETGETIGRHIWDLLPEDQREMSRRSFFTAMDSGDDPPLIRRSILNRDRAFHTHEMYRTIIRDPQWHPIGMRYVALDVTETEAAQKEEQNSRLWLESVVNSVVEAVLVTDSLGFIRNVNPAAEMLFGWSASELTGQQLEKRIPTLSLTAKDGKPLSFYMALDGPFKGAASVLDRSRTPLAVEITASPIVDKENGSTRGVVSIWRRLEPAA